MIKSEQVKINNIVMQGNDIATVVGLPFDDFIQYEIESRDNDIIYGEPYESFEPLKLTEEWLIKFQLPKRQINPQTSTYYIYSIREDFEIYCHMDHSGNCLFWGVNSMGDHFFIIKCDTVHVFQKTYAVLNPHEELKIK